MLAPNTGVVRDGSGWCCPSWGVSLSPDQSAQVLDLGWASIRRCYRGRALPWLGRRAVAIPPRPLSAGAAVSAHIVCRWLPLWVVWALACCHGAVTGDGLAGWLVGWVGLAAVSIVAHEAGHAVALRTASTKCAYAVVRWARAEQVRPALESTRDEVVVVIGGPIAPLLISPLVGPLIWALAGWAGAVGWGALVTAHLGSLIIPAGDGANLRQAIRHGPRAR